MTKSVDNIRLSPVEAADEIVETIHSLRHLIRAQRYRPLQEGPDGITPLEGRVLSFFSRHPNATQSEFVAHSGRDKGQVARLIGALRGRGLLETRADEVDRRIQRLHLTAQGRAIQASVQEQRLRVARLAVADLDDEQRQVLVELLRRVRSTLEAAG